MVAEEKLTDQKHGKGNKFQNVGNKGQALILYGN